MEYLGFDYLDFDEIRRRAFEAGVDIKADGIRYREDGYQLVTRDYFTRLHIINKLKETFGAIEVEIMTDVMGALIYNIVLPFNK